ncbi:carboxypeptidase-like regulatory domain-containing protein [Hymenobacter setariae]|uniref:Carboxypeptidase-like regulatory domain-containing protein n=1 Tax=Hymenobacter setariae TaxID=2594794 RepID=A0A558BW26_9BACT|nr:carboxypeptidase-like regulatory domain-containing protein [Hymenobacter setariae]TVT40735.1 carboxypeptidase-like regulatory domain-containing protein [Hymenobacter setariae]
MRYLRLVILLSCWLGAASAARAQGRITGVVQDSVTHEPLAFSSVFLANTTLGATTNENGAFVLERVPKGTYDIVGSYVGYKLSKQSITVTAGATAPAVTLRLTSSGPQLAEVVVKADAHQEDNYRKFIDLFVGKTTFSKQCRITNPEDVDVDFNDTTKTLTATTPNFVQIENKALGYRIKYYGLRFDYNTESEATGFDGQTVFEEMKPKDEQQRRQWAANRVAAYNGSLTHFLKSVYDNQVKENNFLAQQVRLVQPLRAVRGEQALKQKKGAFTAADRDSMRAWDELPAVAQLNPAARPIDSLRRVSADGRTFLRFTNELQVVFFGEAPDPGYTQPMSPIGPISAKSPTKRQVSRLTLLAPETEIQPNGTLANPLDVVSGEYWGFQKIGEFLPLDYAPPVAAAAATPGTSAAKR